MPRRKVTDPKILVDAAARLFQQKGYQNTTIDDLAEEVGISKPTVYQYVKSKGWLLETIFETVLQRLKEDQVHVIETIEDPAEQFRETIRHYVQAVADLRAYFNIFFGEEAELPARLRKKFRVWAREMTDVFADILAACGKRGEVRTDVDPRVAAFLLIGMLASTARWFDPKGPLSTEDLAEQVIRMMEGYLTVKTAAPRNARAKVGKRR